MKYNDRLQRIQIGRETDVPLFENSNLWFLVIYQNGDFDAESNLGVFLEDIKLNKIKNVFCIWHGNYRTNLFLLNNKFILKQFNNAKN